MTNFIFKNAFLHHFYWLFVVRRVMFPRIVILEDIWVWDPCVRKSIILHFKSFSVEHSRRFHISNILWLRVKCPSLEAYYIFEVTFYTVSRFYVFYVWKFRSSNNCLFWSSTFSNFFHFFMLHFRRRDLEFLRPHLLFFRSRQMVFF